MVVGPKHYEGWTCNECEHLKETTHFYCFNPDVIASHVDNRIENRMHIPIWCPHLRYAMLCHVVENR